MPDQMPLSLSAALGDLRTFLLNLQPTGDPGFEGLVATVLARMTGLVIRLAKSGSQFGRDGSSLPATFAVAMEAKRYDADLRLEDLLGKLSVAASELADRVDLYVLGATSAVGDDTAQKLTSFLEDHGVVLLTLDWTEHPLPPLAVALAVARAATLEWFAAHAPSVDRLQLAACLDVVAAADAFASQDSRLKEALGAAHVGLEPFRRHAAKWFEDRLARPPISQQAFGQYITVRAPGAPPVQRRALADLERALTLPSNASTVVAVLGAEGTGKTWLAAHWWTRQEPRPPFLFVAGNRTRSLDPADSARTLARLIAEQHGVVSEAGLIRWQRRLKRWGSADYASSSAPRLIVVLDGINEHPRLRWASIIGGLARELHAFGGRLVITSRPAYWEQEVRERLGADVQIADVLVGPYTDEELREALAESRVNIDALSGRMREFVRNPRICRAAMGLLDRLSLNLEELTVERLLLEYLQQRLQERGDYLAHNIRDFEKLLQEHARKWLRSSRQQFDRDNWAQFSGAVKRMGLDQVIDDVTEIEEGRFMTITDPDRGKYTFRPEALPFAIGLLFRSELRDVIEDGTEVPEEALARMLDPVRGFDQLADIVTATICLACFDSSYPERGRTALINTWLSLQNVNADAINSLGAYFIAFPDIFLDVIERPAPAVIGAPGAESLIDVLHAVRDHRSVAVALEARFGRWLGRWCRDGLRIGNDAANIEREARRKKYISERLSDLSTEEHRLFDEFTTEAPRGLVPLDQLTARLSASGELCARVDALMGWALAQIVASDFDAANSEVEWVVRLNRKDAIAVRDAARAIAERFSREGSRTFREAAALLLRTLGDRASSVSADALAPLAADSTWQSSQCLSATDPYNPQVADSSSVETARATVASLDPIRAWMAMGMTSEDYNLERNLPLLIRFDLPNAVEAMKRIVATASHRRGTSLRQISWRLPELSPLFDGASVEALRTARDNLLADREQINQHDYFWVLEHIMFALAPQLSPTEQLEQLLLIPEETPLLTQLQEALRPLSPADTESAVVEAAERSDSALIRTLLFVAGSRSRLTERARETIVRALRSRNPGVASFAANVVYQSDDAELDAALISAAQGGTLCEQMNNFAWLARGMGRAIAMAVVRRNRGDALDLVPPRFLEYVAAALRNPAGSEAQRRLVAVAKDNFERLCRGELPPQPSTIALTTEASVDGLEMQRSVAPGDVLDDRAKGLTLEGSQLSVAEAERRRVEQQEAVRTQASAYLDLLEQNGGGLTVEAPPFDGLARLAAEDPSSVRVWLQRIATIEDPRTLGRIQNIGYALASVSAGIDGDLAARIFRHLDSAHANFRVTFGREQVWVRDRALFQSTPAPAITDLRRERFRDAFDDAALADASLAAELCGSEEWLDDFVRELLGSASAGEVARGLTVTGFRRERRSATEALGSDWGKGFLGGVAQFARDAYARARWAHYWLEDAAGATNLWSFWRATELAIGVADARALLVHRDLAYGEFALAYSGEVGLRLEQAAKKVRETRANTLFGLKRPPNALVSALLGRSG